jgi:hypothetical protein
MTLSACSRCSGKGKGKTEELGEEAARTEIRHPRAEGSEQRTGRRE